MQILRAFPLLLVIAAAACGPSLRTPQAGPGAEMPAAAVERFLRLAAEKEYAEMGWVFGTDRGPVIRRDSPQDVERRMFALANLLENEMFVVSAQSPVPGRTGAAMQFDVLITQRGRQYTVPFTTVRGPGQRWFVEQVQVEAITGR
ncbi:hypothetical protein BH23GEM3_BH23GEM3_12120 [soil metagenome]